MDQLMRLLAPRSTFGFVSRLAFLIAVVAVANVGFALIFDDAHGLHAPGYYLTHAAFVGGPLIAFFLAVTVFQIRLQGKLWRLSRKDELTGLNNRRTFFDLTSKARTQESSGVLLMLDADWFKRINDTYGHKAGDKCLQSIASVLRQHIRQDDIAGRIGGEEFAIYLNKTTLQQAKVVGERLTKPIHFQLDETQQTSVTLSIGAVKSCATATLDEMFVMADNALYRAKLNGRAQIVIWDGLVADARRRAEG